MKNIEVFIILTFIYSLKFHQYIIFNAKKDNSYLERNSGQGGMFIAREITLSVLYRIVTQTIKVVC